MISILNMSDSAAGFPRDAASLSIAKLAFVGDAVYELYVRKLLVGDESLRFDIINDLKQERVCAKAQAAAAERILPLLTEGEFAVYRRARNAKHKTVPKNASGGDYSKATGLEALLGHLYLSGEEARLLELLKIITA